MDKNSLMSAVNRSAAIQAIKEETFDLIVIGGGVTGCGIALDAASRGLKTVVLEKEDFASGTSSKSTKLIHGGLRYLKQLDFALVRETGTERAIVHQLAPHLVLPEKMLMPLVKGGNYGYWGTSIGLTVYDILAGVSGDDRRKMVSKKEALAIEPLLDEKNLKGGGFYAEYRTDDARLTIELMKTAVEHGAKALNYCQVEELLYEDQQVVGVQCTNLQDNSTMQVRAKTVVSAGGPWVDTIRKKDKSLKGKRLFLSKGVHLVVPHEKLPLRHTIYFDVPDGRMVFAIPRGKVTYIGTTDTEYYGDKDRIVATKSDAAYLINAVKSAFPSVQLTLDDIESNWAGLRPLIHEDGKSPSELSRKDEIFTSPTGLISIAGGKLTGYRKMAQRIVDLVYKEQGKSVPVCKTKKINLTPNPIKNAQAVEEYIKVVQNRVVDLGLDAYYGWYLVTTYGHQTELLLEKMNTFKNSTPEIALARAEAWFGVHYEMVNSLEDFFVRRTGRLYFNIDSIPVVRDAVTLDLIDYLSWDDVYVQKEQKRLDELLFDATNYYEKELEAESIEV